MVTGSSRYVPAIPVNYGALGYGIGAQRGIRFGMTTCLHSLLHG